MASDTFFPSYRNVCFFLCQFNQVRAKFLFTVNLIFTYKLKIAWVHLHRTASQHFIHTATAFCRDQSCPPDDLTRAYVIVMRSDASTSPDADWHATMLLNDPLSAADTNLLDFPNCYILYFLAMMGKSMLHGGYVFVWESCMKRDERMRKKKILVKFVHIFKYHRWYFFRLLCCRPTLPQLPCKHDMISANENGF